MKSQLLYEYKNGNYTVRLYSDGTKIRTTMEDDFVPSFPESMDINISNKCSNNCPFCYINASEKGEHGDLELPFFNTIPKGVEIAINYADHPGLPAFLDKMKEQGAVVNITVNQKDLIKDGVLDFLINAQNEKKIYGIGVSAISYSLELASALSKLKNVVLHLVLGVVSFDDIESWKNQNRKVLFLGYKTKGRGVEYKTSDVYLNINEVKNRYDEMSKWFNVLCFDNLALDQIDVKSKVPSDRWENLFLGDDGQFSFYIDTVSKTFNISSNTSDETKMSINGMTVKEMFDKILETHKK